MEGGSGRDSGGEVYASWEAYKTTSSIRRLNIYIASFFLDGFDHIYNI